MSELYVFNEKTRKLEWILNEDYKEIHKLHKMCSEAGIPCEFHRLFDGWQVVYNKNGKYIADAVEHFGSYGHEQDLLEIMGLIYPQDNANGDVLGYLTADDVFARIKRHWEAD